MNSWIIYAVLGMLMSGLMTSLYKVPASKKINRYGFSAWMYLFSIIFASIFLHNFISFDLKTTVISFLWGTTYAVYTLLVMNLLHKRDTSEIFPFTSLASNVLVVIVSVLFLNEYISFIQWFAICLAVVFLFISSWSNKVHFVIGVLPMFALIATISAFNKFVQKFGASSVEVHNFIFWQLVFAFIASVMFLFYTKDKSIFSDFTHLHLLKWAAINGFFQFCSTYTIAKALSTGPASMVFIVIGFYTLFASLFAGFLFKEKITKKTIISILVSIVILLLIKIG